MHCSYNNTTSQQGQPIQRQTTKCCNNLRNDLKGVVRSKPGLMKQKKRTTINSCLLTLGANLEEVYRRGKPKTARYAGYRTIYDQWPKAEILGWAGDLYRRAIKLYHPDLHGGRRRYQEKMQDLNLAYEGLKRILSYR